MSKKENHAVSTFIAEGEIIMQGSKTYWFKRHQFGTQIDTNQALNIWQGLVGRKLTNWEFELLTVQPYYATDTISITIVSMLVSVKPVANWPFSFARTVIGYVRRAHREGRFEDEVNGSEGFYLPDGRLIGELKLTRVAERPLEAPLLDPIDLAAGGLGSLITRGGEVALKEGLTEVAEAAFKKPTRAGLRVLLVGPETEAEFDYARSVMANGGRVTAVNPVRSPAAERFIAEGGHFVQGEVGSLSPKAEFDIIREDFPYPTGNYIDPGESAARITRLKPGGAWVVVTEATDYANTLVAAAELNKASNVLRAMFLAADEAAPVSAHPRALSRTALVITR
jgi:hypothetical protein